jgi:hypothetical protein
LLVLARSNNGTFVNDIKVGSDPVELRHKVGSGAGDGGGFGLPGRNAGVRESLLAKLARCIAAGYGEDCGDRDAVY